MIIKKIHFALSLILLCTILTYAFQSNCYSQNSIYFQTEFPVSKCYGDSFKIEISAKVKILDDSAKLLLFARVENENQVGFEYTGENFPIKNSIWKKHTILGKIDSSFNNLVFGETCYYSGTFYLDDFIFSIKKNNQSWTVINKNLFENNIDIKEWYGDTSKYFKHSISISDHNSGKSCLVIEGIDVPHFGCNKIHGKYAKVNGINLYFETYGKGIPLIMLHANSGSISTMSNQLESFADKYKVIAIDSRGHGKSVNLSDSLSYDLMVSDINELLNQLKIDSAYFLGFSDGAIISLMLAMQHPEKVKKIVSFGANLIPDESAITPACFKYIVNNYNNPQSKYQKNLLALMLNQRVIPFTELHKISAEVLVLTGDRDLITLNHTTEIFKNIPKANLCVLPGTTHLAYYEDVQLFNQIVTRFFDTPFKMPKTEDYLK